MSGIVALWQAIVDELATGVPELREVRMYRGEFEGKDKGKIGIRTPGALVYVTGNGVSTKLSDSRLKLHVTVSVAVICEDRGRGAIDTTAAEIAEEIVGVIHENRFRVEGVPMAKSDPDAISILNYNSDETLSRGLSVWGVAWEQAVLVGEQKQVIVPGMPEGATPTPAEPSNEA